MMPGGSYTVNEKGEEVLVERTLSVEEAAAIAAAEAAAADPVPAAPETSPAAEAPAEPEASTRRGKRENV